MLFEFIQVPWVFFLYFCAQAQAGILKCLVKLKERNSRQ